MRDKGVLEIGTLSEDHKLNLGTLALTWESVEVVAKAIGVDNTFQRENVQKK
jgi:hypothetical protein